MPSSQPDDHSLLATYHIPIAELTPLLPAPATRHIRAVVALIWPYSSSAQTLTILVSEPDFRLRRLRGQVRVRFIGPCAQAIAQEKVLIGDLIDLALDGAEWVKEEEETQGAPGKGVEWQLRFTNRLAVQVGNDHILYM